MKTKKRIRFTGGTNFDMGELSEELYTPRRVSFNVNRKKYVLKSKV